MRYYNYLTENKELSSLVKGSKFVDYYIKTDRFLYRGTKKDISTYSILTRRKDRQPTHTNKLLHDLFDLYFKKKFGWKVRSEGVFTTSSLFDAKHYGNPYIFVPLGSYNYIHHPYIADLYLYSVDEGLTLNDNPDIKKIEQIVDGYKKNPNIDLIITRGNETIFDVDKYLLINPNYFKDIKNEIL